MTWEKRPVKAPARMRGYVSASWTDTNSAGRLRAQQRDLLRRSERPVERVSACGQGHGNARGQSTCYKTDENAGFYFDRKELAAEIRSAGRINIRPIFGSPAH